MSESKPVSPRKQAAGYFLGVCGIGLLVLLWFRGLLRPMMPVLIILAGVLVLMRVIKAIRAPVD